MNISIASNPYKPLRATGLVLAALLLTACTGTALYTDLEEQQANEVMAALLGAGIDASKSPSPSKKGWEVDIAAGDIPEAMRVLRAAGLPQRQSQSMGELFKKDSFATSTMQEKALYVYGLEEGMRKKLLKVDGVVDAEVSIALPDKDPLAGEAPDSSASVMIFERPGANLSDRETDLKVYIKDGIAGLNDVNKVTIKFFPAGTGAPQSKPQGKAQAALSDISPLNIAIALGVALLIGLGVAFGGRLHARFAGRKPQSPTWEG